jgi:ACT domain-containing protein
MQGYFNMMMIVDTDKAVKSHEELARELTSVGHEIGVQIKTQKEEIFDMMHRV